MSPRMTHCWALLGVLVLCRDACRVVVEGQRLVLLLSLMDEGMARHYEHLSLQNESERVFH